MGENTVQLSTGVPPEGARKRELITFFILAFAIWPLVAVAIVGGYGFMVWMWQIIFGPPGPPAGLLH